MMKVVHVVLSLDCGGLERIVVDLVRQGAALGQRATVVCLEHPGVLAPEAEALGSQVICLGKRPGLRPGLIRQFHRLFRELQPDVVHTHQIAALLYAGPAARRCGVPVTVHTEHSNHFAARPRRRWLGWVAGRYADRFCCVSDDIASEVTKRRIVPLSKVHVVPNGIEVARFRRSGEAVDLLGALRIPPDALVIGTIGRLRPVKRQDLLIRAFARIRSTHPCAHLLIVGDGPQFTALRQLAGDLGLSGSVHLVGHQPAPSQFLSVMNVFALTSSLEGMPLVILEAWAAEVPVVASRVGGVPELIEHGWTGLLFESGDQQGLAAALSQIMSDPALASRVSEAGRCQVERHYSSQQMAENYQRHYLVEPIAAKVGRFSGLKRPPAARAESSNAA